MKTPLPDIMPGTETRTHCPYCALQCGMVIRHDAASPDTPAVIRGDEAFPVNNGQMCIKGFNSGAMLRHPQRLLTPLKRAGQGWQAIDHRTAIGEIGCRLRDLRNRHGRDALAAFGSGSLTNEKAYLLGKLVRVAFGGRHIDYNGRYCMSSAAAAQNRAFGVDRGMPFPVADIAGAKTVMLWGSNLADTLPPIVQWFQQQKLNGGRTIVVDPRRTETARGADLHLQLTPGSDLALLNGLLVLAQEMGLVDRAYVDSRTRDFHAAITSALKLPLESVERLTGISLSTLRTVIAWLADGRAMLLSGRGPEQQGKGVDTVHGMINLMLALGQVGKPFAGYGTLTGQGNGQGGREHGQKCDQLPGYRSIENPTHRAEIAAFWGIAEKDLPRKGCSAVEMIDLFGEEIHSLLLMGSNLAVASPDADQVVKQLRRLDLLVVVDPFLNETAELADYVLPTLHWAEEEGTLTNLEGRVLHRRPSVPPPPAVPSDITILCDIAREMGAAERFAFASSRAVFDEFRAATRGGIADYSGITYEQLDAHDGIHWPCHANAPLGTPRLFQERFFHPDGLARFFPVEHRPGGEEVDEDYPICFTTGRYREHYNSGAQTRRIESLLAARPRPLLQIHPRLAVSLGLADGQCARVISRRAIVDFQVHITADIRPDTVFAPFHYGGKDAANRLVKSTLDPISRMPEFKSCAVRIEPVDPIKEAS